MNIEKSIKIEEVHRIVFDKIYVQHKVEVENADVILASYERLVTSYPNFRQDLYDFDNKKYIRYKYHKQ